MKIRNEDFLETMICLSEKMTGILSPCFLGNAGVIVSNDERQVVFQSHLRRKSGVFLFDKSFQKCYFIGRTVHFSFEI